MGEKSRSVVEVGAFNVPSLGSPGEARFVGDVFDVVEVAAPHGGAVCFLQGYYVRCLPLQKRYHGVQALLDGLFLAP